MNPQPAYFDLDDHARLEAFQQELDAIDAKHRQADQRKKAAAARKADEEAKKANAKKAA